MMLPVTSLRKLEPEFPLPTNCSAPALMLSSFPLETSQGEAFFFLLRITLSCALISIFFTSFWTLLCWSSCSLCYQSLSIGSSCVFSSIQNNSLDFTSFSLLGCGVQLARVPRWSVGASGQRAFPKRTPDKSSRRTHISWDLLPRVLTEFRPLPPHSPIIWTCHLKY